MDVLLEHLYTSLPIIVLCFIFLVLLFSVYKNIRRKFSINVNCWFCNCWIKVSFKDRNSFSCTKCLQYNGFSKDGTYNKIIPEQHDELLNPGSTLKNSSPITPKNGLCKLCNNNQQLKIYQLANFVPMFEENYDKEIEHFQKQLEKAYKLCKKCDNVFKRTIEKQNAWFFGSYIKKLKGFSLLDLNKSNEPIKIERRLLFNVIGFLSGLCSFSIISIVIYRNVTLPIEEKFLFTIPNKFNYLHSENLNWIFNHLPKNNASLAILTLTGFLLQILLMWDKYLNSITKTNQFLCWLILVLTNWIPFNENVTHFVYAIQVFAGSCIIYSILKSKTTKTERQTNKKLNGKMMRNLVRSLETTCPDISEETFQLNKTANFTATLPSFDNLRCGLNNLRLDSFKDNSFIKKSTPILSPSKLNFTQSGLWKNSDLRNKSRTSSESSGFESQTNDVNNQYFSNDFDRVSMLSDCNFELNNTQLYYKCENSFYPVLNNNNSFVYQENRNFCNPLFPLNKPLYLNSNQFIRNRTSSETANNFNYTFFK